MLAQGAAKATLLDSLVVEGPNAYTAGRNDHAPVS